MLRKESLKLSQNGEMDFWEVVLRGKSVSDGISSAKL